MLMSDLLSKNSVRFGTSGVRGLVTEMTDELCFAFTLAFLQTIAPKKGSYICLSMDLRPSSPNIAAACAAAIRHYGLNVDFCGKIPTPALALYAQKQGMPAIMITGSHIPFDRNGIKYYGLSGEITKSDEMAITQSVIFTPEIIDVKPLEKVNLKAYSDYIDRYADFFEPQLLSGLNLGFYEHSSVARDILAEILKKLGAKVTSLGRTDNFIPIDTEAVSQEDIQRGEGWAKEYKFDAIVSTDGDADRPLISDENGKWFRGDMVGILCAQYLGAESVVTTLTCNTAIDYCASFREVEKTAVGSPFVIEGMKSFLSKGRPSVVGFEPNGGFLVGSRFQKKGRTLLPLGTRDAILPILALLASAQETNTKLSSLLQRLPKRYTASNRLVSFSIQKSRSLIQELQNPDAAVSKFLIDLCGKQLFLNKQDGVRIGFKNTEIIHIRASGNAPELRCYTESVSQSRADFLLNAMLQKVA